MQNTYVFKEDVFISNLHLVKAGAKVKVVGSLKEEFEIVLMNDPFKEKHKVDKNLLVAM